MPALLLPVLTRQAGDRSKSDWLFPSPRKTASGNVGRSYPGQVLTRCVARANEGREEKIRRLNVHSLRHTFASMALSEAEADIISVSHALGHARSSITVDVYGHLSQKGLGPLMAKIDALVAEAS